MSGRHGLPYEAQCLACATLALVVWQYITNLSIWCGERSWLVGLMEVIGKWRFLRTSPEAGPSQDYFARLEGG